MAKVQELTEADVYGLKVRLADLDVPEEPPAKTGRPRSKLDAEQQHILRVLSMMGANQETIAACMGVTTRLLQRRRYVALIERNRRIGHAALLRKGWLLALQGDTQMLRMLLRSEGLVKEPTPALKPGTETLPTLPLAPVSTQRTTVLVLLPDNGRGKGTPVSLVDVVAQHGLYPIRPDDPDLGGEEVPEETP